MKDGEITVAKDTQIINTMTEGKIMYMRELGGVSKFAGLQDVLPMHPLFFLKNTLLIISEFISKGEGI